MSRLLSCPFCGSSAVLLLTGNDTTGYPSATTKCGGCGMKQTQKFVRYKHDKALIVKLMTDAWNRRTPDIVYCRDCDHVDYAGCANGTVYCMEHACYMQEPAYCSYANREGTDK